MRTVSKRIRRHVEEQGFTAMDDDTIAQFEPWLRLVPALSLIWIVAGIATESAAVFWLLVPFAWLGSVRRGHPFEVTYNYAVRHLTGTIRIPPSEAPRKFAHASASVLLALAGTSYYMGARALGGALAGMMVLGAAANVSTGFCFGSYLYNSVTEAMARRRVRRPEWKSLKRRKRRETTQPRDWGAREGVREF